MAHPTRGDQHGWAAQLEQDFTSFTYSCIMGIGIDATDPQFPTGTAMLFSGDDEYYTSATPRFDARFLPEMLDLLAAATVRLNTIVKIPSRPRGTWSIVSKYAQDMPEDTLQNVEQQTGLLAVGTHWALVLACGKPSDREFPIVNFFFRAVDTDPWTKVKTSHAHWLKSTFDTFTDAVTALNGAVSA